MAALLAEIFKDRHESLLVILIEAGSLVSGRRASDDRYIIDGRLFKHPGGYTPNGCQIDQALL
jgi:hypothetical protein